MDGDCMTIHWLAARVRQLPRQVGNLEQRMASAPRCRKLDPEAPVFTPLHDEALSDFIPMQKGAYEQHLEAFCQDRYLAALESGEDKETDADKTRIALDQLIPESCRNANTEQALEDTERRDPGPDESNSFKMAQENTKQEDEDDMQDNTEQENAKQENADNYPNQVQETPAQEIEDFQEVAWDQFLTMLQDDVEMRAHWTAYCKENGGLGGLHWHESSFIGNFSTASRQKRQGGVRPYVGKETIQVTPEVGKGDFRQRMQEYLEHGLDFPAQESVDSAMADSLTQMQELVEQANHNLQEMAHDDSLQVTQEMAVAPTVKQAKRKRKKRAKQERGPEGEAQDCEEELDAAEARQEPQAGEGKTVQAEAKPKVSLLELFRAGLESDVATMRHWRIWSKAFRSGQRYCDVQDEGAIRAFTAESMRKRRAGLPPHGGR